MPEFRMTIRFGEPRSRYHVADITATSLADALRQAVETMDPEVDRSADLVEIRRTIAPDAREYGPE